MGARSPALWPRMAVLGAVPTWPSRWLRCRPQTRRRAASPCRRHRASARRWTGKSEPTPTGRTAPPPAVGRQHWARARERRGRWRRSQSWLTPPRALRMARQARGPSSTHFTPTSTASSAASNRSEGSGKRSGSRARRLHRRARTRGGRSSCSRRRRRKSSVRIRMHFRRHVMKLAFSSQSVKTSRRSRTPPAATTARICRAAEARRI
mmetsp:Transcript_36151/g.92206  ORF Transcript_36151/g.92206 Transcript_36151/m.92206 type:complete len:208 (-) Transcript_36151:731-1354(-)